MNEHLVYLLNQNVDKMDRRERLQRRILALVTQRLMKQLPQDWKVY